MLRVHVSRMQRLRPSEVRDTTQTDGTINPRGLWYAFGDAWIRWATGEMPSMVANRHAHSVVLKRGVLTFDPAVADPDRILVIRSRQSAKQVSARFGVRTELRAVHWRAIAREFAGIEVRPEAWPPHPEKIPPESPLYWVVAMDVPGGCLWRPGPVLRDILPFRATRR
jgi:hypothetical protein